MDNFFTVKEAVQKYIDGCGTKLAMHTDRVFGKAILAGMMIAFGAAASNVASHNISNVGLARLVAGIVFPVGLMMVVLLGTELFTGDCLMTMANAKGTCSRMDVLRFLVTVYFGNFIGAVLLALATCYTGQLHYSNDLLGAYTIKVALGKVNLSFGESLLSGILCNILVCSAVLMAMCARDVAGKLLACFFTILLFVTAGYEHCVANMYYITAGLIARNNLVFLQLAGKEYGYTAEQLSALSMRGFIGGNLLPVTLGNMVGGILFGLALYYLNHDKETATDKIKEEGKHEHRIIFGRILAGIRS